MLQKVIYHKETQSMHVVLVDNTPVPMLSFTHIAQELDHTFRSADAHQLDLIAEQNLQGNEHQNLTGTTYHLVPHPKEN